MVVNSQLPQSRAKREGSSPHLQTRRLRPTRVYLVVLGAFALVVSACWIAGSVLVVVASAVPSAMSESGLASPTAP